MDFDVGVKDLERFEGRGTAEKTDNKPKKPHKDDLGYRLTIELDGLSELTRIDTNQFFKLAKESSPDFSAEIKKLRSHVFRITKFPLTNEAVDSVAEAMFTLDGLKELVFEAGGYEKALDFACDKFKVGSDYLVVRSEK